MTSASRVMAMLRYADQAWAILSRTRYERNMNNESNMAHYDQEIKQGICLPLKNLCKTGGAGRALAPGSRHRGLHPRAPGPAGLDVMGLTGPSDGRMLVECWSNSWRSRPAVGRGSRSGFRPRGRPHARPRGRCLSPWPGFTRRWSAAGVAGVRLAAPVGRPPA